MAFDFRQMVQYKEKNVGTEEQKIRYGLGFVALLISVFTHSVPLLLGGGALVATAKANWCPIWSGLGKNTCENPEMKRG